MDIDTHLGNNNMIQVFLSTGTRNEPYNLEIGKITLYASRSVCGPQGEKGGSQWNIGSTILKSAVTRPQPFLNVLIRKKNKCFGPRPKHFKLQNFIWGFYEPTKLTNYIFEKKTPNYYYSQGE